MKATVYKNCFKSLQIVYLLFSTDIYIRRHVWKKEGTI